MDVLGNGGLLNDVLAIVTGNGADLEDEIVSDIGQVVAGMEFE